MLFSDLSSDIIKAEIAKERREVVDQYETIRERLKDYLEDRQTKNEYIRDWGFKLKDGSTDLPLQSVNITAKIINKISLTYKYQPKRMLMDLKEGQEDSLALWYADQPEFGLGFKYAERYKNLLGKVLYPCVDSYPELEERRLCICTYYLACHLHSRFPNVSMACYPS